MAIAFEDSFTEFQNHSLLIGTVRHVRHYWAGYNAYKSHACLSLHADYLPKWVVIKDGAIVWSGEPNKHNAYRAIAMVTRPTNSDENPIGNEGYLDRLSAIV